LVIKTKNINNFKEEKIMAASKQMGIKEVLNLEIMDYVTGKQIFFADYATNTTIESSAERLDLRGGQGNYKLMSFDHTKNTTLKCELPIVDLEFIAYLSGKPLVIGNTTVPAREILTTATAGTPTVTLASTPASGTAGSIRVFLLSGDRDNGVEQTLGVPATTPNTYSISGKILTLNNTSAPVGTTVVVSYNYVTTSGLTRTITLTADKFLKYVSINGYGIISDEVDGNNYPTIFKIFKAKPKNNWTLSMAATEATKLSVEFDIYAETQSDGAGGTDKVMVKMYELV
jgi:hypothetical protein